MARDPCDSDTRDLPGLGRPREPRKRKPESLPAGILIGYARVSTADQSLATQLDALKQVGVSQIYQEHVSGKDAARPELANALKALRKGDTLIVARIDRLGRSVAHLIQIVDGLRERGIALRSLSEPLFDTTTAAGSLLFGIVAVLAQYHRELIIEGTRAGLEAARARGRTGGRKPVMTTKDVREALAMLSDKSISVRQVCERLKVKRSTLYRHLRALKQADRTVEGAHGIAVADAGRSKKS